MNGVVTRFFKKSHKKKNPYGFIKGEDGQNYYFSPTEGEMFTEGDEVRFISTRNEKGACATYVRKEEC